MKTLRRGLTLGKYAPLHRGHQLVIETALAEMDEVVVLIYDCPQVTSVPLSIRSAWIRRLYPAVRVIEAWDGPTVVGDTPQIKKLHEDYIVEYLKMRDITHFYSSEFYGEHMSAALNAVNREVDRKRLGIPISATQIRRDPFGHREFLHPIVYRDLITNVVFLGAPSTGKTTIASRLAREFNSVWMPEYGREYWEQNNVGRRLSLAQLEEIAEEHLQREDDFLLQANRYLFTDTNALTTWRFSQYYHGAATPRLEQLSQNCSTRYDMVFLCDDDTPYDDTEDRSGEANRAVFEKQIRADLQVRRIPFHTLRGDIETRVATVKKALKQFQKYCNLLEPQDLRATI